MTEKADNSQLRHGWGGDLDARKQARREIKEAAIELNQYPFPDAKFGDGPGDLTSEDWALLSQMEQKHS